MDLTGHSGLITGGTQGVGGAIAVALARSGADVLIHGLEADSAAEQVQRQCQEVGVHVDCLTGDLATDPETAAKALFAEAVEKSPRLDLLVCNAGTFIDRPFLEMDWETFDRTMKLNVYAYYFLAQAAARYWVDHQIAGRIVLIGSINGRLAEPDHTAYDTSKGAIEMMVKSLCVSLAPHGIRVNGMAPGLFHTPLTAPAFEDPSFVRWMELHTPNGQVPSAEVCGDTVAFLLSDQAQHIHGHMMMVDGGMSIWQQPDPISD